MRDERQTGSGLDALTAPIPSGWDPRPEGERLVSRIRLVLSVLMLGLAAAYALHTTEMLHAGLLITAVDTGIWALISMVYLSAIRSGRYRPLLSYLSVAMDIVFVTVVQVANTTSLDLNFINGPIFALYFVMIALAALRQSPRLVLVAGVGSAVVHAALCAAAFYLIIGGPYRVISIGGYTVELPLLDQMAIALAMAVSGWLVGRVTAALRDSESHYQDLFEHVPDGILIVSRQKRVLAINHRFAEMSGYPFSALLGRRVDELLRYEERSLGSFPPPGGMLGSPTALVRSDGGTVPVRTAAAPLELSGEECIELSVRDVADHVMLEKQLAQAQKMETVGRLAGGLARDFGEILEDILAATGEAESAAAKIGGGKRRERTLRQLEIIRDCCQRAYEVIARLRTFSRFEITESEPVDLVAVAEDVATICRNTFPGEIEIDVSFDVERAVVEADATTLTQALLNLCINSRDALGERGRIEIRIFEGSDKPEEKLSRLGIDTSVDLMTVEISDNGIGMDEETLERIFDPFFTTKSQGEGTGLGLSMVYNAVGQHGGIVDVESEPGRGTTFRILLPLGSASLVPEEIDTDELPRGSARVLVVDDDDVVRATVRGMLVELGYSVTLASSGEEAIELAKRREAPWDLVILDMVMPKIDGPETLRSLRAEMPDLAALVISGFWTEERARELKEMAVDAFLRKPFTFKDLATTVTEALAGKRSEQPAL
ncbi:MAG: ATP-binding protein [Polyangia bacterium]